MRNIITVFLLTFSIITALLLPVSALLPTSLDAELYSNVIRLHVIANSDSREDQELKLKVRDEVLSTVSELLSGITDRETAEYIILQNIHVIKESAANVISSVDSSHKINVTLTNEEYPTRSYGAFSLPAGTYTSLRVLIGDAEGKNWWCMLYPSLCVGAITEFDSASVIDDSEFIEAGLTPGQVKLITGNSPEIKIKFRLLELFSKIFS